LGIKAILFCPLKAMKILHRTKSNNFLALSAREGVRILP